MAEVHVNARARVFHYDESDELMAPLPPPPLPQARPSVRGVPMATAARAAAHNQRVNQTNFADDDELIGAPQPAPVPHTHPLAALSSNSSNRNHQRVMNHKLQGKRLNPAFFNRERIAAFIDKENQQVVDSEAKERRDERDAYSGENEVQRVATDAQEHTQNAPPSSSLMDSRRLYSTRFLQSRMLEVESESTQVSDLLEEERIFAATDASQWRHELHSLPVITVIDAPANGANNASHQDSALERARLRKVKKQVDPKWLQTQSDASNRPRAPLERDDELHLREVLLQTTVSELLSSGVLFDADEDAKKMMSFPPPKKASLPIYSSGTTGLPGCCYDSWSH